MPALLCSKDSLYPRTGATEHSTRQQLALGYSVEELINKLIRAGS